MICPMSFDKDGVPDRCEKNACAWWVEDEDDENYGDCCIYKLQDQVGYVGDMLEHIIEKFDQLIEATAR